VGPPLKQALGLMFDCTKRRLVYRMAALTYWLRLHLLSEPQSLLFSLGQPVMPAYKLDLTTTEISSRVVYAKWL